MRKLETCPISVGQSPTVHGKRHGILQPLNSTTSGWPNLVSLAFKLAKAGRNCLPWANQLLKCTHLWLDRFPRHIIFLFLFIFFLRER